MNLIDQFQLDKLATTEDTRAVRLILRQVNNLAPYTINGRNSQYVLAYDATLQAHKLDIPESVWMNGVPGGAYTDNGSLCHDILANRATHLAPLVPLIVPMNGGKADPPKGYGNGSSTAPTAEFLAAFRALFNKLGAPPIVMEALDMADTGNAEALREFVDCLDVKPPETADEFADEAPPAETITGPGLKPEISDKMRKMREAKAAKRQAQSPPA